VSSARRGGKAARHWRFWEGGAGGGTLNLMVGRGKGEGRARTTSMSRFHQLHPTDWRRPAVMHGYDLYTQDKYQSRHAELSPPEPTHPPRSPETPPCTPPRGGTRGVHPSPLHPKQNFASWLTLSNPTSCPPTQILSGCSPRPVRHTTEVASKIQCHAPPTRRRHHWSLTGHTACSLVGCLSEQARRDTGRPEGAPRDDDWCWMRG